MIVFRYRWHTGSLAWIVHRVTGVALTLYIFVHLYVLSRLGEPAEFEKVMGLMRHPLVKAAEVGLMALVAAHALNGVRLTLLDLGLGTRSQKPAFWAAAVFGLAIVAAGALAVFGGGH